MRSGRSRPVATKETETFRADMLITAVGVDVEKETLSRMGLSDAEAAVDPSTQETRIAGVFLIGDAAQGAETIVKAIASAQQGGGCHQREGRRQQVQERQAAARRTPLVLRSRRDRLIPASASSTR